MARRSRLVMAILAVLAAQANAAQAKLCGIVRVEKADFGVRVYFGQGTALKHGAGFSPPGWASVVIDVDSPLPAEPIKPVRPLKLFEEASRYRAFAAASGEIFSVATGSLHVSCRMEVLSKDGRLGIFAKEFYDGHGLRSRVSEQTEFIPAD